MAEPSRKRTFQAREQVWGAFESMARERGAVIDELVTEAMASYAKARGYVVDEPASSASHASPAPGRPRVSAPPPAVHEPRIYEMSDRFAETQDASSLSPSSPVSPLDRSYLDEDADDLARTSNRPPMSRDLPGREPPLGREPPYPPPHVPDAYRDTATRTRPRHPAPQRRESRLPPAAPPPMAESWSSRPPPPAFDRAPPAAFERMPADRPSAVDRPRPSNMPPAQVPGRDVLKRLTLTYEGQTYVVDKDRFLLGRSKTQADLRLDDPNVSRQHAVIERVGAAWYVVDLGSTNGVLVGGERVARRALADGDLIVITAHEIRCSLR